MSHHQHKFLSQKDLEELAKDPKNRVYQYEYDSPTAAFSASDQKKCVHEIRQAYVELVTSDNKDDDLRKRLISANPQWKKFAENHAKSFAMITDRTTPNEFLLHMNYMIYLREQQECGRLSQGDAQMMIQDYLVSKFKTDKTLDQYKKEMEEERKREQKEGAMGPGQKHKPANKHQ